MQQVVHNQEIPQEPLQAFDLPPEAAGQTDAAVSLRASEYGRWQRLTAAVGMVLALSACGARPHTGDAVPETTAGAPPSSATALPFAVLSPRATPTTEAPSTSIAPTTPSSTAQPSPEVPTATPLAESLPLPADQSQFTIVVKADGVTMSALVHRKDVPLGAFYTPEHPEGTDWSDSTYSPNASPFPQWPGTGLPSAVEGHKCHFNDCPFNNLTYGENDTGNVHKGTEIDFVTPTGTRVDKVCGVGLSPKDLPDDTPNPSLQPPVCEGPEGPVAIPDGVLVACNITIDADGTPHSGDNIVILTLKQDIIPAGS